MRKGVCLKTIFRWCNKEVYLKHIIIKYEINKVNKRSNLGSLALS